MCASFRSRQRKRPVFFPSSPDIQIDTLATAPVSWGGKFPCAGSRRVLCRQIALFVSPWFIVSTVRSAICNSWGWLLIVPFSEILRSGLRVDLTPLCDLVERLSGLFIMAYRLNSRRGMLHNVTLPRSWFVSLILPGTGSGKDTSTFPMFASTVIELMHRIDAQVQRHLKMPDSGTEEQFVADNSRIITLTGPLYIARM